jgi:eukaryotic-like serine/threonine-protein kinase
MPMRSLYLPLSALLCIAAAPGDASAPIVVPDGLFLMGSEDGAADEQPVHPVTVKTFAIDRDEVTNGRYRECVEAGVCSPPALATSHQRASYFADPRYADFPVIFVSWYQADTFCRFAGGRLPSEAEWEKAARGASPSLRTYPWGDEPPDCTRANYAGCVGDTDKVGQRPAGQSPYGVMDMAGNVWEWVADWYDPDYYRGDQFINPDGPADGMLKVMRGGCWESGASSLRVSCRKAELPRAWAENVGLRCAYDQGGAR